MNFLFQKFLHINHWLEDPISDFCPSTVSWSHTSAPTYHYLSVYPSWWYFIKVLHTHFISILMWKISKTPNSSLLPLSHHLSKPWAKNVPNIKSPKRIIRQEGRVRAKLFSSLWRNVLFSSDFLSVNESSRCWGFLYVSTSAAAVAERTARAKRREMGITVCWEHIVEVSQAEWAEPSERWWKYGTELRSTTISMTRSSATGETTCKFKSIMYCNLF